jgi:hypothetical protein
MGASQVLMADLPAPIACQWLAFIGDEDSTTVHTEDRWNVVLEGY